MNTIRELKQQEKYKSMLKRKNKEKKIYKDKNASLQFEKQKLYRALLNREKEIERLNKEIKTLKQPQVFIDTQDMEERYGEELYKEYLEKENKRLNNIINELEEYIKWQRKCSLSLNNGFTVSRLDVVLNKLQELKGSDK